MNSINQGDQTLINLQDIDNFKTPSNGLSDLFAQVSSCGYLTRVDRYGLMLALLNAPLSEEEQAAIDRLFYAVNRGRIRLVDEIAQERQCVELSTPEEAQK